MCQSRGIFHPVQCFSSAPPTWGPPPPWPCVRAVVPPEVSVLAPRAAARAQGRRWAAGDGKSRIRGPQAAAWPRAESAGSAPAQSAARRPPPPSSRLLLRATLETPLHYTSGSRKTRLSCLSTGVIYGIRKVHKRSFNSGVLRQGTDYDPARFQR